MRVVLRYERVFCVHKEMILGVHSYESARSPFDSRGCALVFGPTPKRQDSC